MINGNPFLYMMFCPFSFIVQTFTLQVYPKPDFYTSFIQIGHIKVVTIRFSYKGFFWWAFWGLSLRCHLSPCNCSSPQTYEALSRVKECFAFSCGLFTSFTNEGKSKHAVKLTFIQSHICMDVRTNSDKIYKTVHTNTNVCPLPVVFLLGVHKWATASLLGWKLQNKQSSGREFAANFVGFTHSLNGAHYCFRVIVCPWQKLLSAFSVRSILLVFICVRRVESDVLGGEQANAFQSVAGFSFLSVVDKDREEEREGRIFVNGGGSLGWGDSKRVIPRIS